MLTIYIGTKAHWPHLGPIVPIEVVIMEYIEVDFADTKEKKFFEKYREEAYITEGY
jgi:hypothetical protein